MGDHPLILNPEYIGTHTMVEDLVFEIGWDIHVLHQMFDGYTIERILSIQTNSSEEDILRWVVDPPAKFTSKTLCDLLGKKNVIKKLIFLPGKSRVSMLFRKSSCSSGK